MRQYSLHLLLLHDIVDGVRLRGWPVFDIVKQKEAKTVLPHTQEILVFLGSNWTNRKPESRKARGHAVTTSQGSPPPRLGADYPHAAIGNYGQLSLHVSGPRWRGCIEAARVTNALIN